VGSDSLPFWFCWTRRCFNSRSRVGSDLHSSLFCCNCSPFQFALPRGERPGALLALGDLQGFNSRSRVGSDPALGDVTALKTVSIRAPAWGATHMTRQHALQRTVSIRAPAWGATHLARLFRDDAVFQFALPRGERRMNHIVDCLLTVFQFALPRGERPGYAVKTQRLTLVSIRAPAWGATFKGLEFICNYPVSIRAPAWGATFTTSCW